MHADCRGLTLTSASAGAATHIDQAVTDYLDYRTTAFGHVRAALEQDPAFVLALCFRGYFLLMLENKAILPKVRQTLDEIRPHLTAATSRERGHARALQAWAAGDIMLACAHWEEILAECPLDLMALKLHHTMSFYAGRSQVMRAVIGGVLGEWDDTVPGYGCVQGMYAYALEECGAYADAERWGRQAVEKNPGDLWAVHSVAHVLEMQGRSAEGVKWLSYTPQQWTDKNPFKAHVWWHAALFLLAQGDYDRALDLYDQALCSVNSETYVDVSNQAALLKRLQLAGVDVGDRWKALAEHSQLRIHDHMLPFRDAHFCLALAAHGDFDVARRHLASMTDFAAQSQGWRAEATRNVLVPLCEGILAYEQGHYDKATDLLWTVRNDIVSIGGSHAQRDLFAQIICHAAVRARNLPVARSLLSERVLSRGTRKANWQCYAEVLAALGETKRADAAHQRAEAAPEIGA
ncbi:MAG TPA: tetratricopeptide repeat protein [Xanthobacteraceae bacterium]|nr:tetratricopeptide repeat protein [Xanthobacteraceae bacterium]